MGANVADATSYGHLWKTLGTKQWVKNDMGKYISSPLNSYCIVLSHLYHNVSLSLLIMSPLHHEVFLFPFFSLPPSAF